MRHCKVQTQQHMNLTEAVVSLIKVGTFHASFSDAIVMSLVEWLCRVVDSLDREIEGGARLLLSAPTHRETQN